MQLVDRLTKMCTEGSPSGAKAAVKALVVTLGGQQHEAAAAAAGVLADKLMGRLKVRPGSGAVELYLWPCAEPAAVPKGAPPPVLTRTRPPPIYLPACLPAGARDPQVAPGAAGRTQGAVDGGPLAARRV